MPRRADGSVVDWAAGVRAVWSDFSEADALRALDDQVAALEAAITAAERWEGGKPVGAEPLRDKLAGLLAARRALCGEHMEGDGDGNSGSEDEA